jgi:hypothetical protein
MDTVFRDWADIVRTCRGVWMPNRP